MLAPANEALTNECLTGPITEYDWVEGIVLMTIFVLFFVELMVMRFGKFGHVHGDEEGTPGRPSLHETSSNSDDIAMQKTTLTHDPRRYSGSHGPHVPGDDHLGHSRDHVDNEDVGRSYGDVLDKHIVTPEAYAAQMTAIFILEFGVIFHSIFIGLTLAVSGEEFSTLYIVLVFHQSFEGLALGTRLASVEWPKAKRWTPYLLGAAYAISTPIAIAVGLGVRNSYPPNSSTTLIVNGVFDSISAGILIYTGLVELMAHEFMFSTYMQRANIKVVLSAFGVMCLGAGLMALLGKWA